jgi:purine-binding chemotaxis protein CheW
MAGSATAAVAARAGKYLTFQLGPEIYGLEILKVQEIVGMMKVTRVPGTPGFVRGVINLRGQVIPVVDMRLKFSMPAKEDNEKTCIIVVQVAADGRRITMGTIVDEVSEVQDIAAGQIEDSPSFGENVRTDFLIGMGKVGQKLVLLLDVDKVMAGAEIVALEAAPELAEAEK